MDNNLPIGLLDSGIGGLTVLKQALQQLPKEKFIFIGDQKYMPYGPRTKEDVTNLTRRLVKFLISKKVKAIVFACNTATAEAMEEIQLEVDVPLIGVVEPGSKAATAVTNKKLGIIATEGTIKSQLYTKEVHKLNSDLIIFDKATPTFVPMIEAGKADQDIIKNELQYFDDKDIETIILGCTHYPIIANEVAQYFDNRVQVVDPSYNTVEELKNYLDVNNLLADQKQSVEYYTTADADKFASAITRILKIENPQAYEVNLDD